MTEQTDDHDKLIEMKAAMDDLKRSQDAFNCAMFGVNGKPGVQATLAKLCESLERYEKSSDDIRKEELKSVELRLKTLEAHNDENGRKIDELEKRMDTNSGKETGKTDIITLVCALIAALGVIASIVSSIVENAR